MVMVINEVHCAVYPGGLERRVLRRRGQHKVRVSDGVHDDDALVERDRLREEHGGGARERVEGSEVGYRLFAEGDGEDWFRRCVRSGWRPLLRPQLLGETGRHGHAAHRFQDRWVPPRL